MRPRQLVVAGCAALFGCAGTWAFGQGEISDPCLSVFPASTTALDLQWSFPAGSGPVLVERSRDLRDFAAIATLPTGSSSYQDLGLVPGSFYAYRVRSAGPGGGALACWNHAATLREVGDGPAGALLNATWLADGAVSLDWRDPFGSEEACLVERQVADGAFELIETLPADRTATNIPGPHLPDTDYRFRIRFQSGSSQSLSEPRQPAIYHRGNLGLSSRGGQYSTTVAAPVAVSATALSTSRIDLSWTHPGADTFEVLISYDGGRHFRLLETVAGSERSYSWDRAYAGGPFHFRIVAQTAGLYSLPSGTVAGAALAPDGALPSPENLTAEKGASGITLQWTHPGGGASGFSIEKSLALNQFQQIAVVAAGSTSYLDAAATSGTYRVQALGASAGSSYTDAVAVTQDAYVRSEDLPGDLAATVRSSSRVDLSWTQPPGQYGRFVVQRAVAGESYENIGTSKASDEAFQDWLAPPDSPLSYRLVFLGSELPLPVTSAALATTPSGPASAPQPQQITGGGSVTAILRDRPPVRELLINGSSGADEICVEELAGILSATVNELPFALPTGEFDVLVLRGESGEDVIRVGPGFEKRAMIYGGSEDDTVEFLGRGPATIVTIGGGEDTVAGNGVNTIYWCDQDDAVAASQREVDGGRVHRVGRFHQAWSSDPAASSYVGLEPGYVDWADGFLYNSSSALYTDHSFWGLGPVVADVDQGFHQDCPVTSYYQGAALAHPEDLEKIAVDLGDGTFAVQVGYPFDGLYARVDHELRPSLVSQVGVSGTRWWPILEKVVAFGLSLPGPLCGLEQSEINKEGDPERVFAEIQAALAAGKTLRVWTDVFQLNHKAVLSPNHQHSIVNAYREVDGTPIVVVRNPYGKERMYNDVRVPNLELGLTKLTVEQFQSNFYSLKVLDDYVFAPGASADTVNLLPEVALLSPLPGATVGESSPVTVTATAADPDGTLASVVFLLDGAQVASFSSPPYAVSLPGLSEGVHELRAIAIDAEGGQRFSSPVTVEVLDDFAFWVALHGLPAGSAAYGDDPDRDGLDLLLEFALGLNPTVADREGLPEAILVEDGGVFYPAYRFHRFENLSGLTYQVEWKEPPGAWEDGSSYSSEVTVPANEVTTEVSRAGSDPEEIVVRSNKSLEEVSPQFFRLGVSRP